MTPTPSLSHLLWAHLALLLLQFGEKLLWGRGFDGLVRRRILPEYDRALFALHHLIWWLWLLASLALFELVGARWVILPLAIGLWATSASLALLVASLWFREVVPGVVSGLGFFGLQVLIVRDHVGTSWLSASQYTLAAILGVALGVAMLGGFLELRRGSPLPSRHRDSPEEP